MTNPPLSPGGLFTGPTAAGQTTPLALPTLQLALAALLGSLIAASAATLLLLPFTPSALLTLFATSLGATLGFLASTLALLALRPWNPRPEARWPFALLGAQAFSCLLLLALDGLVYFSAHLDPLPLALASVAGFLGAWVAVIRVFSALLKRRHARPSVPGSEP